MGLVRGLEVVPFDMVHHVLPHAIVSCSPHDMDIDNMNSEK